MAMVNVVLKWQTSTTYQSYNYESLDLQFGKVDYVTRFTNPAQFGEDCISGGASKWWWTVRVACLSLFLFSYSLIRVQPIPVNRFSRTVAKKMRTDSRKCPLDKSPKIFAASREIPAKMQKSNNSLAVEDRRDTSTEQKHQLGATLSESVIENDVRRP